MVDSMTLPSGTRSRPADRHTVLAPGYYGQRTFWPFHWLLLLVSVWLAGCTAGPAHQPDTEKNLPMKLGRIQHIEQDDVSVQVSIPTDDEASRNFGVPFAQYGIQPIWLRIENASEIDYWLMPIAVDPDYYSADEAARVTGAKLSKELQNANTQLFRTNALPFFLEAGSRQEGYIYASYKRGGRFVDVRLSGHLKAVRMRFAVLLPTESFDYENSELRERLGFHRVYHHRQHTAHDRSGHLGEVLSYRPGECSLCLRAQAGCCFTARSLDDFAAQPHAPVAGPVPLRGCSGLGRAGEPRYRCQGDQQITDLDHARHRPSGRRIQGIPVSQPAAP
jgi:hypothetical protein